MIYPTSIQLQALQDEGLFLDVIPALDCAGNCWYWDDGETRYQVDADTAADAMLEHIVQMEGTLIDLQRRASVGDALVQSLQAQELIDQLQVHTVKTTTPEELNAIAQGQIVGFSMSGS